MSRRGTYRKGEARREEILDAALTVVARVGYSGATIRELADAVGLSSAGVLHHFGTRDELFAAILRRSDTFDVEWFATAVGDPANVPADLAASFLRVIRHHQQVPGLIPVYIRNAAEATEPEHPDHESYRNRQQYAQRLTASAFRSLQRERWLESDLDVDALATMVLAMQDGLRLRWLFDPTVDMPHIVAEFFRLLDRPSSQARPARPQTR